MFSFLKLAAATVLTSSLATAAVAAPLTTEDLLRQFNAVVFDGFVMRHDVEGRLLVGGALTGSGDVGSRALPASSHDALVVLGQSLAGGDLGGFAFDADVKVLNGGNAAIDGDGRGTLDLNAGPSGSGTARFGGTFTGIANQGTLLQGLTLDLPDLDELLGRVRARSTVLDALGGTAPTIDGNRIVFAGAAADAYGRLVYRVDADDLPANGEITVVVGEGQTAIINVFGDTDLAARNIKTLGSVGDGARIVYNFVDAEEVVLGGGAFIGSVVAPFANVTNHTPIEGAIIALAANQHGEYHARGFDGMITTPLPPAAALFAAGLVGLGWFRRRA